MYPRISLLIAFLYASFISPAMADNEESRTVIMRNRERCYQKKSVKMKQQE
jgi:hypothetical protein